MALHVFDPDEIEFGGAGTLVYEQPDDTAAALTRLGLDSFAAGNDASSEQAALNATIRVDAALEPFWRGHRLSLEQALLMPSAGAYARDKRLLRTDLYEERFLRGYRLVVEKVHAGTLIETSGQGRIKRHEGPSGEVEFFAPSSGAIADDPDIWPLLARVMPPL